MESRVMKRIVQESYLVIFAALLMLSACGGSVAEPESFVCPDALPAVDGPCEKAEVACVYMVCGDFGVATATCRSDLRWDVQTIACGELDCAGQTCAPGFICVEATAGIPQGQCVENSCGGGPIGCDCPGCPSGTHGCNAYGLKLECNACNADICP